MLCPDRIGLARAKMVQAETDLDCYIQGGRDNAEHFKQLSAALKISRDEYVDELESFCPPFHE